MASKLKAGTTNAQNSQFLSAWCSVNDVLRDISPRWKMVLLHGIAHGVRQFSQLKRTFPTLSDQVLGQRLAELVAEGLVEKAAVAGTVPHTFATRQRPRAAPCWPSSTTCSAGASRIGLATTRKNRFKPRR